MEPSNFLRWSKRRSEHFIDAVADSGRIAQSGARSPASVIVVFGHKLSGLRSVLSAMILPLLAAAAAAQGPKLIDIEKNIELCNRVADVSPDMRIGGCTALIESGAETPRALALAYN